MTPQFTTFSCFPITKAARKQNCAASYAALIDIGWLLTFSLVVHDLPAATDHATSASSFRSTLATFFFNEVNFHEGASTSESALSVPSSLHYFLHSVFT